MNNCPFVLNAGETWVRVPRGSLRKAPKDATLPSCGVTLEFTPGVGGTDQDITGMLDWFYVTGYIAVQPPRDTDHELRQPGFFKRLFQLWSKRYAQDCRQAKGPSSAAYWADKVKW